MKIKLYLFLLAAALYSPVNSQEVALQGKNGSISHAISHEQGLRSTMEDAAIAQDADKYSLYGVYDGHGGDQVSKYIEKRLPELISQEFNKQAENQDISSVLEQVYKLLDAEIAKQTAWNNQGAAAVTALYLHDNKDLYIANAGDSRAVVAFEDGSFWESFDHKPGDKAERVRIERAGGMVFQTSPGFYRVNGQLAVARALGDHAITSFYPGKKSEKIISSEPDITAHQGVIKPVKYIILACDGLWDVMSSEDVKLYIDKKLTQKKSIQEITEGLVQQALKLGSNDNITVLIKLF